jgi:hypothetical protein
MTAEKKTIPKRPSLEDDLKGVTIPFDLFTAFALVSAELKEKKFIYDEILVATHPVFIFKSKEKKEKVLVNIGRENLLIKQFYEKDDIEKLKVLYVVKPSERNFNLI